MIQSEPVMAMVVGMVLFWAAVVAFMVSIFKEVSHKDRITCHYLEMRHWVTQTLELYVQDIDRREQEGTASSLNLEMRDAAVMVLEERIKEKDKTPHNKKP